MESRAETKYEESNLVKLAGGTLSFIAGLTAGSTFGTASAILTGKDMVWEDISDGKLPVTPSERYMSRCYLVGRTIGQAAILGSLIYGISTSDVKGSGFLD